LKVIFEGAWKYCLIFGDFQLSFYGLMLKLSEIGELVTCVLVIYVKFILPATEKQISKKIDFNDQLLFSLL